MKKTKVSLLALASIALTLGLTSCGGGNNASKESSKAETPESSVTQGQSSNGTKSSSKVEESSSKGTSTSVQKTLNSIAVKTRPSKTIYEVGEKLDTAGMVLIATYSDNSTEDVTKGYTVDKTGALTLADTTITVTYQGKTTTFKITVKPATQKDETEGVVSIAIKTQPTKTAYYVGESFVKDGMVVEATYDDASKKEVTNYTIDKTGPLALTDTAITVTFGGKSATVAITVSEHFDATIDKIGAARVEAEDLDMSHAILRDDFKNAGRGFTENGAGASNGKNVCGYLPGSYLLINIDVKEDSKVYLSARMSDTELNYDLREAMTFVIDDEITLVPDEVKFTFTGAPNYWEWKDVNIGFANLKKGKHVLKISAVSARPNLDYFEFDAMEYGSEKAERTIIGLSVKSMPTKVKYEAGETFDPTGMVIEAVYNTHEKEEVTDYTIDKTGPLTVADTKVVVTYEGVSVDVAIEVGKTYLMKVNALGDHIFEAENLPVDEGWVMRQDMKNAGFTSYVVNSSDSSNGQSIERYDSGTVMKLEFYVGAASKIHFSLRASNFDDFTFDDGVEVKMDENVLTSNNPAFGHRHASDWYNWINVDFGVLNLAEGEHVVTITMKGAHPNLDCLSFHAVEYGEAKEEHTLSSIAIASLPNKVSYTEGEILDLTGLTLHAVYADSLTEVVTEGFTVDKTAPLTVDDTTVTVTFASLTATFHITVLPAGTLINEAQTLKIEAEDMDYSHFSNNGNGQFENTSYASGGKCLGNGLTGYTEFNLNLAKEFKVDITAVICKYEPLKASDQFKLYIDSTQLTQVDPDMILGRTDGNDWFNFKNVDYTQITLSSGVHTVRIEVPGCNFDCISFVFAD